MRGPMVWHLHVLYCRPMIVLILIALISCAARVACARRCGDCLALMQDSKPMNGTPKFPTTRFSELWWVRREAHRRAPPQRPRQPIKDGRPRAHDAGHRHGLRPERDRQAAAQEARHVSSARHRTARARPAPPCESLPAPPSAHAVRCGAAARRGPIPRAAAAPRRRARRARAALWERRAADPRCCSATLRYEDAPPAPAPAQAPSPAPAPAPSPAPAAPTPSPTPSAEGKPPQAAGKSGKGSKLEPAP